MVKSSGVRLHSSVVCFCELIFEFDGSYKGILVYRDIKGSGSFDLCCIS